MIEALCDRLSEKPGLYLGEMAVFLWDEFQIMVTTSSIRRALVPKVGPNRLRDKVLGSRMPICESIICILSRTFNRITWYTSMNLDVINGLGLDGQAGHHSV